ncbi:methyltransferase family protein [Aurantiacibacter gangjinensis]|uniref:Protein-S-isoprenylcysteine methyltransferase n=1 Tax=Aurantiacibacter gangjinensis TaxID=502682 RepID=A0A0G9MS70_9SPHN|nr:isoprenylcysteine carboxylmethyltransferase family protein [Aurantiacibacter gangjinensis]APE28231.1 GTP-binding protein EngA [Aurantiacibacter gangjinensis]KLE32128.1 protein-S-isoprenylcysteine methyltransferase [Aurantiacibacter gangjinensis]
MNAHSQIDAPVAAEKPPASDVSAWVGLVGLVTLLVCILFARSWPDISQILGWDTSRGRLSGPHAALAAMAVTGLAMAAWSVLVDKVHRSTSTGIDWTRRRAVSDVLDISITKLAGLWATWFIIGGIYILARWYWEGNYVFAMRVIGAAAIPMFLLSVPYVVWLDRVMVNPRDHCWHFGAMLVGREAWDAEQVKKHWRAWIIKGFFSAFMISIIPAGFAAVVETDIADILGNPVRLGVFLFEILFVIDVQIGTVGYLLTLRPLDAHIRSGNPFLAGWVAALLCYPPFAYAIMGQGGVLQYEYDTADWAYWFAGNDPLLYLWAAWLVFLTAIYAWATVAFGIRFSNLTYRGVITHGPYRYTRHPAYLSKNIFWWCCYMPFLVTSDSTLDAVRNTVFIAAVSAIYYWRARTEEAHLLAEDPKYRQYYDWMAENGVITARLARVVRWANPRKGQPLVQPAE